MFLAARRVARSLSVFNAARGVKQRATTQRQLSKDATAFINLEPTTWVAAQFKLTQAVSELLIHQPKLASVLEVMISEMPGETLSALRLTNWLQDLKRLSVRMTPQSIGHRLVLSVLNSTVAVTAK